VTEAPVYEGPVVWTPDKRRQLAELCRDDWPRLAYDGFGIMVSPEQEDAYHRLGQPGPRNIEADEHKNNWLSGGQRGGKTVFAGLCHIDAALYKRGLDNTDPRYWRNYQYGTLAIAPTTELTLRLYAIMDAIAKGSNEAQWDTKARRSRGGAFIGKMVAGKADQWPIVRFDNGSRIDFRSSEGYAYRLEGGQWWFITWDEWASQPDREIRRVLVDVLYGRARDHDAKIMPMAWPKAKTEHHLLSVIRGIESGRDRDSQVIYLDASTAPWTNQAALEVELRDKTPAEIKRTIKGLPAGGAAIEFKEWMVDNAVIDTLPPVEPPLEGFGYFTGWDLGAANDDTIGTTFRIPIVNGRRMVTPQHKCRIVDTIELRGGETLSIDTITANIQREQGYYGSETAIDATGLGGVFAVRQLRNMVPKPYEFKSRAQDRIWGNMRLAAITNGLDMFTWARPEDPPAGIEPSGAPWGLVEMPRIQELIDQLFNFDRDATDVADDWVWSLLIGLWYIRRFWVLGESGAHWPVDFNLRQAQDGGQPMRRRAGRPRARLIAQGDPIGPAVAPKGIRYIKRRL
jgi:hypothetical protein